MDESPNVLRRLLRLRFDKQRPRRLVQSTTLALGWIARRLPTRPGVRVVLDRTLGPAIAWSIRELPSVFDVIAPSNERYWAKLEQRLEKDCGERTPVPPFARAVHAWFGVEASVMTHGERFQLPVVEDHRCVERLYLRTETGVEPGGCPWGLRRAADGFACRTIMMGSRHVFNGLGHARMSVDIGIPEMLELETMIAAHLVDNRGATAEQVWSDLNSAICAVFRRSAPAEDDFFVDGALRSETQSVVQELIAALVDGRRPALFCQFRILPR